ncbi:hypothetical protein AVEN_261877-1 [Araneus ventricosus]|uniref:Uncharacterized protein n=1 Tax=Araneus ventricosus TaxID=182803 RepID=A0A4Y2MN72_ARAVE|nr:hypothetical protein AVEN_261877-1 [Araneus ventricosus]
MEYDRYGVSDRTATSFASAVLQDTGIAHEGEASHVNWLGCLKNLQDLKNATKKILNTGFECDADDPGFQTVADDEIIVSVIDDQDS